MPRARCAGRTWIGRYQPQVCCSYKLRIVEQAVCEQSGEVH